MILLDQARPEDASAIEALLDRAFGRNRHRKTAQRLRDGRVPADGLAFVVRDHAPWGERLVGTLTFWNVGLGPATPGLMLGPLAVDAEYRSRGLGGLMIRRGLAAARERGHGAVILVGDAPYYERFGFTRSLTKDLVPPGPVDQARFLGLELKAGAMAGAAGIVRATGKALPAAIATHAA
jgi:predicted N-acetyltransferase YhbS